MDQRTTEVFDEKIGLIIGGDARAVGSNLMKTPISLKPKNNDNKHLIGGLSFV